MSRQRAVCRGVEAILAVSSAVASLIVVCVAGASLSQVNIHLSPDFPPAMGKPAIIFALVAACLNIFMSYAIAVVRILQIRLPGITFNRVVVIIFSCLMMFFASIIIASFGAAGILSAIAAARPSYEIERIAVGYLIATSPCSQAHSNSVHKKWEASTLVASYMKSRDRERKSGIPSRSKVIRLVTSFVAFLVMVCFMLYELVAGLWIETKTGDYTEIQ